MTQHTNTDEPMDGEFHVCFRTAEKEWNTKVSAGMNLLEAARQCDAPVHTLCNGIGACVQCKIRVIENGHHLSKPEALEKDLIGNIFHITGERLGCQARVSGDVVVEPLPARLPKRKRFQGPIRSR